MKNVRLTDPKEIRNAIIRWVYHRKVLSEDESNKIAINAKDSVVHS